MANMIPFEGNTLPAYITQQVNKNTLNDDLVAHASAGFPVISIKGKIFAVVKDGERKVLTNPKDPDSPAPYIDIVMVKANKGTSKVFYIAGYSEGGEAKKPDCFSADGITPDPSAESPQSKQCATCKNNVWGSKIGDTGQKGKACQDSVRLAISTPGQLDDPHLLRVPPASIRALGEYGKELKKRGVEYQMVVTRIGFDVEAATPKLTFKPIGFLPEDVYKRVKDVSNSDVVKSIIGSVAAVIEEPEVGAAALPSKDKTVSVDEVAAAVAKAAVEKAAKPKPEAKKEVAKPVEDVEIDLDSLSFDD